jgi:hypothetical protein
MLRVKLSTLGADNDWVEVTHPIALILTQDCDLEQDFHVRNPETKPSDKLIPSVLLCQVFTAVELRGDPKQGGKGSEMWKRISQNKDERYHFLQKIEPWSDRLNEGLPELAIDFKKYFTLPTEELYRRVEIGEAQRRCVLVSPYMEHVCIRFSHFLSRIALPVDHVSE